jgi:Protein of unknown function (DUF2877)
MQTIAAQARGSFLRADVCTGEVLSIHAQAVNILCPDGLLMSLVAEMGSMTDMSACIPVLFAGGFPHDSGGRAVFRVGHQLEIAGIAKLDLAQGQVWSGTIDRESLRSMPAARVFAVRHWLLSCGNGAGLLGVLLPGRANPFVEKARVALLGGHAEALAGLGPGSTPAGDDFLTGALMARPALRGRDRVEAALAGTTPAGRTLVWMALRSSFPAYLVSFVESITTAGCTGEIAEAVRAACAHGETSGTDALTGFCWAASQRSSA